MTEPNVADEQFESVLLDYLEQRESENTVIDVEAFCELHPDFADPLREYIKSEQHLFQMAGPTVGEHSAWRASADTSRIAQHHTDTLAERTRTVVPTDVPKEFGRYELVRKLGEGAMGSVYLAKDNELERQVALKFPRHSLDSHTDLAARFQREAKSAAALQHRNLCPVLDVGEHEGIRYLSMAFIDGTPLDESIRKGKLLEPDAAADIIARIARAVEVAHRSGIVHRDLKPSNVIIDTEDEPVVMDFGLALHTDEVGPSRLTQDGAIVGTPAYMAPEQIDRELADVGPASDIYSLGVLFYELLTGRLPFEGGMSQVVHQAILKQPANPSSIRPDVSKPLEDICLKMLSKSPADRYGSMADVAEAIEHATQVAASFPPSHRGPHWTSIFAGVGLVSLLTFTLWLAFPTIFKVKTADGMIIVEVPEGGEEIEIEVLKDGKQLKVIDADDGWVMRIEAGEYTLAINDSSDRFVVDRGSLTVRRDDTVRVKVSLIPNPPTPITDPPGDRQIPNLEALSDLPVLPGAVDSVSISPDSRFLVVAGWLQPKDGYLWRYDLRAGSSQHVRLPNATTGEHIAWLNDQQFAIGRSNGEFNIVDVGTLSIADRFKVADKGRVEVAVSKEKDLLGIASADKQVALYRVQPDKATLVRRESTDQEVRALAFGSSPNAEGSLYVGGYHDLLAWNLRTGEMKKIHRTTGTVHHIAQVSGKRLLVVTDAGEADWFDAQQGKRIFKLAGHTAGIYSASISPNEEYAVTGSADGVIRLWSLRSGELLFRSAAGRGQTKHVTVDWDQGFIYAGGGSYIGPDRKWVDTKKYAIHRWRLPSQMVVEDPSARTTDGKPANKAAWITAVRELLLEKKFVQAEKAYTESATRFGPDWYAHCQVVLGLMIASRDDAVLLEDVDRHLLTFEQALRSAEDLSIPERAKIACTLALATHRKLDEKLIEQTALKIQADRWNHWDGYHALAVVRYRQGKIPLALDHQAEAKRRVSPGLQSWLHSYWWAMLLGRHEQLDLEPAREAFLDAESYGTPYAALLKPTAALPADELDAVLEMRWMMPILKQHLAPLESLTRWRPGQSPSMANLDNEIQTLTKQLLDSPSDASLYYRRAIALTRSHRSTEAFDDFRSAAKLDPKNPIYEAFSHYASFLTGDRPQLREYLESIVKNESKALDKLDLADPNSVFVFRLLLAGEFDTHVYAENIAHLQKLADRHPDDWYSQHVLGLWLVRIGKLTQAKQTLAASLKLVDDVSLARYCTLFWVYWLDEVAGEISDAERKTRQQQLADLQQKTQLEHTRPVDNWLAIHESMLSSIGPHELLQRSVRAVVNKPVTHGEVRIVFDASHNKATENVDRIGRQAMDSAGRQIAFTSSNHDKLYLVSTEDGKVIDYPSGGTIRCMQFSEDGKSLIIGRPNKAIDVIDLDARRVTKSIPLTGQPNSIDYDDKGNRLVIAFQNKRCAILDLSSNEMLVEPALLSGVSGTQMGIFFSPDRSHIAIKLKNGTTTVMTDKLDPVADISGVQQFCWIDDQTLCVFHNDTNELQLVKLNDVDQRQVVSKAQHAITALVYLKSLQRVISADANGEITAWSIEGDKVSLARLPQAYIHGLFASGDGRHLLATGYRNRPRDGGSCCTLFNLPMDN